MSADVPREGRSKVTEAVAPALRTTDTATSTKSCEVQLVRQIVGYAGRDLLGAHCPGPVRSGVNSKRSAPHVDPAKLTEITKVASTGKGTPALGSIGGFGGQLFRQNEIRGASFVPYYSRVEETVSSI